MIILPLFLVLYVSFTFNIFSGQILRWRTAKQLERGIGCIYVLGYFNCSTFIKVEALCYKCLLMLKSIIGLEKNFSPTVHCSGMAERMEREIAVLSTHAIFPLLLHCWGTVPEGGLWTGDIVVFSPSPLPPSRLWPVAGFWCFTPTLKLYMCCFHLILVGCEWHLGTFLWGREAVRC